MTNPLDESAKAAAEWVETTPDTVLQACGLVNAYQLGWMDGAMRCADKQATKRVRPRIGLCCHLGALLRYLRGVNSSPPQMPCNGYPQI